MFIIETCESHRFSEEDDYDDDEEEESFICYNFQNVDK